jgi:anionic cell wall polymer biosynthesis LytR-Cps2A-Psr (LCP) family protein
MIAGRRRRISGASVLLALVMAGSGSLAGPVSAAEFRFNAWPWLALAMQVEQLFPTLGQIADAVTGPSAISPGTDGRYTVLLVGSDWRERLVGTGERTDVMMVISINPKNHQMAMLSVPRDVGNFPIGPGSIYKPKVNGLFKTYKKAYGTREASLEHMRQAFAYALDIQIDKVIYLRFGGLEQLTEQVGGVYVSHSNSIYDSSIVDERTTKQHGAKFLAGSNVLMRGTSAPLCYTVGSPINWSQTPDCRRALLYVRTRHGPGNNDWVRARRQQDFITAATNRVSSSNLDAVGSRARSIPSDFYTTIPISTHADLIALYNLIAPVQPSQVLHVVLKPPTYAHHVPGTSKQELDLAAVRSLTHSWFGPVS